MRAKTVPYYLEETSVTQTYWVLVATGLTAKLKFLFCICCEILRIVVWVLSNVYGYEYGCAAWDPYLSRDVKTLEQIQNRALRFIFRLQGRVSFSDLRKKKQTLIL